jgi:hypothetical protein
MKKCFKCGQVVASNEKNCPYCGISLKSIEYCPECNTKIDGTPDFCSNCGERLCTVCNNCKKKIIGSPDTCPYCEALLV